MDPTALEHPLVDSVQGLRSINFFNGRLLTASDLLREQQARRTGDQWLGQALGDGVAYGLQVTKHPDSTAQNPMVTVEPGLAINRRGQLLCLASATTLALVRKSKQAAVAAGTFGQCGNLQTGTYVAGPGVYLLTIAPATTTEGKALTGGLDSTGGQCNTDTVVETVQFRLTSIDVSALGLSAPAQEPVQESLFRNRIAALCLGVQDRDQADPFAPVPPDPAVKLAGVALTACDVPLALVYWTLSGGMRFVDTWAVRRRVRLVPDPALALLCPGSERTALGEARLLQFVSQLADLLLVGAHPEQYRIEDYFRYVPPVSYIPVTGAGSPRGVLSTTFLGSFVAGVPDRLPAGMATGLLCRSFAFAAIDLTLSPCLQLFELDENSQAVASGRSSQQFHLFVGRSLDGPAVRDAVTAAFEDAWTVYRGLLRRRVFLPLGASAEEVAGQIAITGALRDVMEVATRQAARAASFTLDAPRAVDAFQLLYDVQKDLTDLFQSSIPGVSDAQGRAAFAKQLVVYLDGTLAGGAPGLAASLAQLDVCKAAQAQNAINQFVGTWSGEGVAVGPTAIHYLKSPQGDNIVPGGGEFPYQFEVDNGTDRRLTFFLQAAATAASGSWQGAATVHHVTTGVELPSIAVPAGGQVTVEVRVKAPSNAQVGEKATLTLTATVPAPNDRTLSAERQLDVEAQSGPPVTRSVDFVGQPATPTGGTSVSIPHGSGVLTYRFNVLYTAAEGPAQADFDFVVALSASQLSQWQLGIVAPDPISPGSPPGTFSRRLTLNSGTQMQVSVFIAVPAQAGLSASFGVEVQSVSLQPAISMTHPDVFNITVT